MATANVQVLVRRVVDEYVDVPVDAELLEKSGVVQNEDGTFHHGTDYPANKAYGDMSGAISEYVTDNLEGVVNWWHE